MTAGQLCTVLAARHLFGLEDLLIASADTLVTSPLDHDLVAARHEGLQGLISVARLPGDKWSFVRLGDDGKAVEVTEKRRISDLASTGIYWFAGGETLLDHADQLIRRGQRSNGEFFVMPVFGRYTEAGLGVGISMAHSVHDMGEPEALRQTERMLVERQSQHTNAAGDRWSAQPAVG